VVELKAPPEIKRSEGLTGALAMILPMFGSMGMMVVMAMSGQRSPRMILMSGLFVVAMLSVAFLNIYRNRTQHRDAVTGYRREYLSYLSKTRKNARSAESMQRESSQWHMPHPSDLPVLLDEGTHVGDREPSDNEFLLIRVGTADQPFTLTIVPAETSELGESDPVAESAAAQFHSMYTDVKDLPLGVDLATVSRIQIAGRGDMARALARAMIVQTATFTDPEDVRIAILASEERMADWEWVKWLPHIASDRIYDSIGPARMLESDPTDLIDLLPDGIVDRPRWAADQGGEDPDGEVGEGGELGCGFGLRAGQGIDVAGFGQPARAAFVEQDVPFVPHARVVVHLQTADDVERGRAVAAARADLQRAEVFQQGGVAAFVDDAAVLAYQHAVAVAADQRNRGRGMGVYGCAAAWAVGMEEGFAHSRYFLGGRVVGRRLGESGGDFCRCQAEAVA